MQRRKRLLIVSALLAVGGAAVGIAYAAIPGGVINGCYKDNSGALRVIDATVAKCSPSESPLDWNIKGERGDPGKDGTNGVSGYEIVERVENIGTINGIIGNFGAPCPSGKKPTGGGMKVTSGSAVGLVMTSYPFIGQGIAGWFVDYEAVTTINLKLTVYVVCVIAA
jgi:hypothetical protein